MPDQQVFINCPFSSDYDGMFRAIVFAIVRCGFTPRCAKEVDNGGDVRISKILRIIGECRYAVHDISMSGLDQHTGLPRFNMPFELGLFIGAKEFGGEAHQHKNALILDSDQFRYKTFLSDIGGQDIKSHGGSEDGVIKAVSSWLRLAAKDEKNPGRMPGGQKIAENFKSFKASLPSYLSQLELVDDELEFPELIKACARWITRSGQ